MMRKDRRQQRCISPQTEQRVAKTQKKGWALVRTFASTEEAMRLMARIGVHTRGIEIMTPKVQHLCILLGDLEGRSATILKQEALAVGAEAAVPWNALEPREGGKVLLMGTLHQLRRVCAKLRMQPFSLSERAEEIERAIDGFVCARGKRLRLPKGDLELGARPLVMGAVNVTPDSFYDGGRYLDPQVAVSHALSLVSQGADILDIGGESSRPGAQPVPVAEEIRRTLPVVDALHEHLISIDTCKPEVAERAIDAGAAIINDITALHSPKMTELAAEKQVGVVLMHMQGTPQIMQVSPRYEDVVEEIAGFLAERADAARSAGIEKERIILDPGIGFGKTAEHNLEILRRLREFRSLGYPLLVGVSRKAFIGKVLDLPIEERLEGTLGAVAAAVMNGAEILRVHDVRECRRAALVAHAVLNGGLAPPDRE
ncbi:MAG: dihydropteroate synthase [Candidatus Thermoplasmatota archaeon]